MKLLQASSYVSSTVGLPVRNGTLDFIQSSYRECINAICKSLIGSRYTSGVPYVIYGLDGDVTPGAIFYNDELYMCSGFSGATCPGSNVKICSIVRTQDSIDPTVLTNSSSVNVHNIYAINITCGASGSGDFDFTELVRLRFDATSDLTNNSATINPKFYSDSFVFNNYASSGTITINLPTTNLVVGSKCKLFFSTGYTNTIDIPVVSGVNCVYAGASLTGVIGNILLEIVYAGNDGTNEVFFATSIQS